MKLKCLQLIALMAANSAVINAQQMAAHFDMSLTQDGKITETITQTQYSVSSQLPVCSAEGIDGEALRFDGYSNFVRTSLPVSTFSTSALTLSVVLAAETYPMMNVNEAEATPSFATICGNLEESTKKGFALQLSSQGDLRVQYGSATGFLMTVTGNKKLECGKWNKLSVVFDKGKNAATLYLNDEVIGTGRMSRADIAHSTSEFWIGKDATDQKAGPFLINTFCGLIDDIAIYNEIISPTDTEQSTPDFNYPLTRYENSLWRPMFHGMPSGSWTNESHGMTFSDGKYHVFFQKNANGPYMARLHWGHISSPNLYDWKEEPIAIAPGENYDIKGCWSGCVYEENGTPYILYTAVDNAKAVIAQAKPQDASLLKWEKEGIIINGKPSGLSDDFRDPYFFTANGKKYIIVGTSKNNIGACTLHKYENGMWTNDGSIFFQGGNANQHGTFWEMPNVTEMGNGKWLFTCTPQNTGVGVRTLCWVGTIDDNGKFFPDGNGVQYLELGGISRDGYGLLSPTIYQKDGKTILLGIVPDKLPTMSNYEMGWAHNFSLPREISLSTDGTIIQKPYSGLTAMRTKTSVEKDASLMGSESLSPVTGRQIELLGEFTVASGSMGFHFLKSNDKQASLAYDAERGTITLDLTSLERVVNDGVYNGIYSVSLPKKLSLGEKLKLHVFLDGSIADIFVNDTWAFSVRIFPNNASQVETEVFATSQTQVNVKAWVLDAKQSVDMKIGDTSLGCNDNNSYYYDMKGCRLNGIPQKGVYIYKGKKYVSH